MNILIQYEEPRNGTGNSFTGLFRKDSMECCILKTDGQTELSEACMCVHACEFMLGKSRAMC